ncbi:MAG: type II toxin-antitoxin system VapC family toxin [Candidatus Bathyarchaeia archaeon]
MRFVDANVFIYVAVKSPKDDFETSKKILRRIEGGEEAVTSTAVLQEVIDWLEYSDRREQVRDFIIAVNSYATLRKVETTWEDMLGALDHVKDYDLSFVDGVNLQIMRRNGIREIYSNDRDFERVGWIHRVWE